MIENKDNPEFKTDGGNDTYDNVFCLSIDEVEKYFNDLTFISTQTQLDKRLICTPTSFCIEQGAVKGKSGDGENACWWWLRSLGSNSRRACFINRDGVVGSNCDSSVSDAVTAVRPAIYLEY